MKVGGDELKNEIQTEPNVNDVVKKEPEAAAGFRKIDCDRWEFANEWFQGGKKHLLKNIKRKSKYNSTNNLGLEAELRILKKNQSELQMEVMKLRQKNEESNDKLGVYEDRIRFAESRQQQMFNFLAKLLKFPSLFHQLIQNKQQQKEELDEGEFNRKKRKLLETQVTKSLPDAMDTDQNGAKSGAKPMETDQVSQRTCLSLMRLTKVTQRACLSLWGLTIVSQRACLSLMRLTKVSSIV
ncbi:hypothetical protein V6N13_106535 [Hibiscus sabdariffa]|uniref:Uncharacterized protein n=1 Tax=Hibiscus sabdariffa TaxID=183260 RepID=A0ABR2F120_9ROSI